jgi:hypothetical protein
MKKPGPTVLCLELEFNDKPRTLRLLEILAGDAGVSVDILRARLDDNWAWMALELRGANPRLREVAGLLSDAACVKDPYWKPHSRAS